VNRVIKKNFDIEVSFDENFILQKFLISQEGDKIYFTNDSEFIEFTDRIIEIRKRYDAAKGLDKSPIGAVIR
jgi:hypothetical protein